MSHGYLTHTIVHATQCATIPTPKHGNRSIHLNSQPAYLYTGEKQPLIVPDLRPKTNGFRPTESMFWGRSGDVPGTLYGRSGDALGRTSGIWDLASWIINFVWFNKQLLGCFAGIIL